MTLKTYDVVAQLDLRTYSGPRSAKGSPAAIEAAKPVSDEELDALALWAASGGLARLWNAEELSKLLKTSDGTQPAAHA